MRRIKDWLADHWSMQCVYLHRPDRGERVLVDCARGRKRAREVIAVLDHNLTNEHRGWWHTFADERIEREVARLRRA